MQVTAEATQREDPFRHDVLPHDGDDEFLHQILPFVHGGLEAGEPILAALQPGHLSLLRDALGADAPQVRFLDMEAVGRNPARIIPVWREFADRSVAERPGVRLRGIGEPIWPERSPEALVECQHHERLIDTAMEGAPLWLVCPYDTSVLADDVVDEALSCHPTVLSGAQAVPCAHHHPRSPLDVLAPPLGPPPTDALLLDISPETIATVREAVAEHATRAGLSAGAVEDAVLAVFELAANSIRHGGGSGTLRIWSDGAGVVHEVTDAGRITDPLVGRACPPLERPTGRGLWMVNQLCDLVQIRSSPAGTTVRIHVHR